MSYSDNILETIVSAQLKASKELKDLIKKAREACESQGHHLEEWHLTSINDAESKCRRCGQGVSCNVNPEISQVKISGPATAESCLER